jgi:hypothetical protein
MRIRAKSERHSFITVVWVCFSIWAFVFPVSAAWGDSSAPQRDVSPAPPPTADAGPDQIVADMNQSGNAQVTLDASGSNNPDGNIVSYVWTEGGTQIAAGIKPTVSLPVGQHAITLSVTDNNGLTDTDTVVITINSPAAGIQPPTADAGPAQTVADVNQSGNAQVTLDASGSSDPNGSIVSYVWTEGGTQIATGVKPTVSLSVGRHTITLKVTDNRGLTDTDTFIITIEPSAAGSQPPTADAGPDQAVTDTDNNGSQQVTLDGSGSSDPDGSIVSYVWTEGGRQIATGVKPTVSLSVGRHTITLKVTDNSGLTASSTIVITVESP